jgi:hypothetical protein
MHNTGGVVLVRLSKEGRGAVGMHSTSYAYTHVAGKSFTHVYSTRMCTVQQVLLQMYGYLC